MINFQQATDSLSIEIIVKRADEIITKAEAISKEPTPMEHIVGLLDIIIWPVALILSLYLFKKQIGSIIDRFESADVSATGLAVKLREGTKKIGEGNSATLAIGGGEIISKSSGDIIPKGSGDIIPKSSEDFLPDRSQAETPYQGLMELQDAINYKLKRITTQKGITTASSSNFALTGDLAKRGIIDKHTASKLKTLIELNTIGLNSPEITHEQVTQMKRLFNNISF